jgi:predicted transcriptional regulator
MRVYKQCREDRTNLMKPNIFTDVHVPLLVFQANTLKRVNRDYRITRTDFTVLAAGYMIEKQNILQQFDSPQLHKTVVGISRNVVFTCIERLIKKGLFLVKENRKNRRIFRLTDKGKACINSFVQHFSLTISMYEDDHHNGRFGYRRMTR